MEVVSNDPGQQGAPQYYRPGPSSGTYPQYPQNPYPQGWAPGTPPAPYPQQAPDRQDAPQAGSAAQWNDTGAPAGLSSAPAGKVARPRQVVSGLVLLLAATLPFLIFGVAALVVPLDGSILNEQTLLQSGMPRADLDAMLAQSGLTMDQFLGLAGATLRVMGAVTLAAALLYGLLAVVAFLGRAGARLSVAILTGVFGLVLLLLMGFGGQPLFAVLVVAVAAVGVSRLYGAPANEWYASRKVGAAQRSG